MADCHDHQQQQLCHQQNCQYSRLTNHHDNHNTVSKLHHNIELLALPTGQPYLTTSFLWQHDKVRVDVMAAGLLDEAKARLPDYVEVAPLVKALSHSAPSSLFRQLYNSQEADRQGKRSLSFPLSGQDLPWSILETADKSSSAADGDVPQISMIAEMLITIWGMKPWNDTS